MARLVDKIPAKESTSSINITVVPPGGISAHIKINEAINSVSEAGGGIVTLDIGTFIISGYIRMKDNVTLTGIKDATGKLLSIIKLADDVTKIAGDFYVNNSVAASSFSGAYSPVPSAMIYGDHASDCVIKSLILNSNPQGQHGRVKWGRGYMNGIKMKYGANLHVYDILYSGNTIFGLGDVVTPMYVGGEVLIHDIYVPSPGCGHDGIYVQWCPNAKVFDNKIDACINSSIRCAESGVEIYNNICKRATGSSSGMQNPGLQLDHNWADYSANYNVHDNYIEGMDGPGIQTTGTSKNGSLHGTAIPESKHNVWIHKNVIKNCGTFKNAEYIGGIHIGGQPNVLIEENDLDGNYGSGIFLMGLSRKERAYPSDVYKGPGNGYVVTVRNNKIANTRKSNSQGWGGYGLASFLSNASFNAYNNTYSGNVIDCYNTSESEGECLRPVFDVRIRKASPDTSFFTTNFNDVGCNNYGTCRSLLAFDLDKYKGKIIKKATLRLFWYYPSEPRANDTTVEIYRPAPAWNHQHITWNNYGSDTKWVNPGGDWYDKNNVAQGDIPYASQVFPGSQIADLQLHNFDVTDLVNEYLSGKYENTGFFIKTKTESDDYIAFHSSEYSDAKKIPQLVIVPNSDSGDDSIGIDTYVRVEVFNYNEKTQQHEWKLLSEEEVKEYSSTILERIASNFNSAKFSDKIDWDFWKENDSEFYNDLELSQYGTGTITFGPVRITFAEV